MAEAKTNAMRMLERVKIPYKPVYYDLGGAEFSGQAVAELTGIPESRSFKTLTARGARRGILVFVIPVDRELDLKKAAAAAGDKSVELLPVKELITVTGYERGAVSPLGMKKAYPTYIDDTALGFDEIAVSAGKKGASLVVAPGGLEKAAGAAFAGLTR